MGVQDDSVVSSEREMHETCLNSLALWLPVQLQRSLFPRTKSVSRSSLKIPRHPPPPMQSLIFSVCPVVFSRVLHPRRILFAYEGRLHAREMGSAGGAMAVVLPAWLHDRVLCLKPLPSAAAAHGLSASLHWPSDCAFCMFELRALRCRCRPNRKLFESSSRVSYSIPNNNVRRVSWAALSLTAKDGPIRSESNERLFPFHCRTASTTSTSLQRDELDELSRFDAELIDRFHAFGSV